MHLGVAWPTPRSPLVHQAIPPPCRRPGSRPDPGGAHHVQGSGRRGCSWAMAGQMTLMFRSPLPRPAERYQQTVGENAVRFPIEAQHPIGRPCSECAVLLAPCREIGWLPCASPSTGTFRMGHGRDDSLTLGRAPHSYPMVRAIANASATRRPSMAALTMPPAWPPPSPQG